MVPRLAKRRGARKYPVPCEAPHLPPPPRKSTASVALVLAAQGLRWHMCRMTTPPDPPRPPGRPSTFTTEVGLMICERIASGESLRTVCADEAMASRATVRRWALTNSAFAQQLAIARDLQADHLAEAALEGPLACERRSGLIFRVCLHVHKKLNS
jgi:hypothetical protein